MPVLDENICAGVLIYVAFKKLLEMKEYKRLDLIANVSYLMYGVTIVYRNFSPNEFSQHKCRTMCTLSNILPCSIYSCEYAIAQGAKRAYSLLILPVLFIIQRCATFYTIEIQQQGELNRIESHPIINIMHCDVAIADIAHMSSLATMIYFASEKNDQLALFSSSILMILHFSLRDTMDVHNILLMALTCYVASQLIDQSTQ